MALVPTPRAQLVRFHGLLGPAAKWRPSIIPNYPTPEFPPGSPDTSTITAASSGANPADLRETQTPADLPQRHGRHRNYTWSELMKRLFAAEVLACIHCGGRLRILTTIRTPEVTRKILDHLGIPSRPPPSGKSRPWPPDSSGIAFENPTKASVDQAIRVRRSSAPVFRA